MTWLIKLIMFVCIVPSAILMYMLGFSGNPGKKKMIFGVRDNPKFHEGKGQEKFDAIVSSARKGGLIITAIVVILSVIMLFLPVNGGTFSRCSWWQLLTGRATRSLRILRKNLA